MSTLVTNNKSQFIKKEKKGFNKKSFILVLIAGLCIVVDNVYAIFGHGVRSSYMSFMFLYPLCGAVVYFIFSIILNKFEKGSSGRFGINLFNSGIATLTVGSFLVGILEIAGSSSTFVSFFFIVGIFFSVLGFLALIYAGVSKK